jgi:hypothetical protein
VRLLRGGGAVTAPHVGESQALTERDRCAVCGLAAHTGKEPCVIAQAREIKRLRDAILDIDAHATGLKEDADGFVSGGYIITVGSLHRALGVIGHTAPKCRLCDPSQHSCATAVGAVLNAAQESVDADDLLSRSRAEERLRDAVRRLRA